MTPETTSENQRAYAVAALVPDPEVPCINVDELGILRWVRVENGIATAGVSPTYSGCPAVQMIEGEITKALESAGYEARIERVMSPPWTTDWISDIGREKLRVYGISPPEKTAQKISALFGETKVNCPKCGSDHTEKLSEFGSTACKAHYRCKACSEPFDHFKCI